MNSYVTARHSPLILLVGSYGAGEIWVFRRGGEEEGQNSTRDIDNSVYQVRS